LGEESEDEEDGSDGTAWVFDDASGTFSDSTSEATGDNDEWYIDKGEPEADEDVYAVLNLDEEGPTPLTGIGNNGLSDSKINWNGQYTV
jgi:hypothetical protein